MSAMDNRIEHYAKLTQIITVIFGILSAGGSLFYSQYDKRVARTTEFSREYSAAIKSDYLELVGRWERFAKENGGVLGPKDPDAVKKIVLKFLDDFAQEKRLLNLLDFLDVLLVCVNNRACDRNTAIDLFDRTANSTFETFACYIEDKRMNGYGSGFGQGVESFYQLEREPKLASMLY